MPRYALLSKGSYIETVQPPSMANRKTCQLKGFPTGELAPEASEEVQLSSGARFKGVNLAPKEKTCYTRTRPNFNFLVFFEFLIEFLVGFPD